MTDPKKFEEKSGVKFKDINLLRRAFTHRSYINENRSSSEHNERLEFLGDAVLELAITDYLYKRFGTWDEGKLTSLRSALVKADTCSLVAKSLDINQFLLLSKGESKDIGRARQYILANALEAVIGAIYEDQGYRPAEEFVLKHIASITDEIIKKGKWVDAKSFFQEKAQEYAGQTPIYKTLAESGSDHDKHFTVGVYVGTEIYGRGEGKSKQDAEQEAARIALDSKGWK